MAEFSPELLKASLWANCIRFGSVKELIASLEEAGEWAGEKLSERPLDSGGMGRNYFEILWDRAEQCRDERPKDWNRILTLMAQTADCVNRRLSSGRLPLAQLTEWGPLFSEAAEAFAQSGANCWKKDASRVSAVDAARQTGQLFKAPWVRAAMATHNRLVSDSVKVDLKKDDLGWGDANPMTSSEWAERFAWEARDGFSSFDLECAQLLTQRFSAAEALACWRGAFADDWIDREELARWAFSCFQMKAKGFPSLEETRPLIDSEFATQLGIVAVSEGESHGSSNDSKRVEALIDTLMRTCSACGADFHLASQLLADKAISWKLPCQFSADPYAKAFAGDQILESLNYQYALLEAQRVRGELFAATSPASATAGVSRANRL